MIQVVNAQVSINLRAQAKICHLRTMFCPKCGKPEQVLETYCRGCGEFLTDSSNPLSILSRLVGANTTSKQISLSLVINAVTAAVSGLLLVFLIGYFDGREARTLEPAPSIIYLVYIFLGLVAAWQLFSFAINLNLRARFTRKNELPTPSLAKGETSSSAPALPEADFENVVPGSVVEKETEILNNSQQR